MSKITPFGTIKRQSIDNFLNYFLLTAIIALSGFEFFYRDNSIVYFLLVPVGLFLFLKKKCKISWQFLCFITCLCIVLFLQDYLFYLPYSNIVTTVTRFFVYFFIASVVRDNFNKVFVNIIYFLCVVSLIFYVAINLSDGIYHFLLDITQNIKSLGDISEEFIARDTNPGHNLIIFKISLAGIERNNGPFWEPGMFAVFINIALSVNLIKNDKFLEKKNFIFLLTSISTLSITSIVATLFIMTYIFLLKRNFYSFAFVFILLLTIKPIYNLPFIANKIENYSDNSDKAYSRFGSHILHFEQIGQSPILGHGYNMEKNIVSILGKFEVSPNGLTFLIVFWGIPMAILFYILYFKSSLIISHSNKKYAVLLFTVMLIVAFSQDVTNRHFYYVLAMLPLTFYKAKKREQNIL